MIILEMPILSKLIKNTARSLILKMTLFCSNMNLENDDANIFKHEQKWVVKLFLL